MDDSRCIFPRCFCTAEQRNNDCPGYPRRDKPFDPTRPIITDGSIEAERDVAREEYKRG